MTPLASPNQQLFSLPELSERRSLVAWPFLSGTVKTDAFLRGPGSWLENPTTAAGNSGLQLKGSWLQTSRLKLKCAGLRSKGPHEVSRQTLVLHWSKQERKQKRRALPLGILHITGPGRGLETSNHGVRKNVSFCCCYYVCFPKWSIISKPTTNSNKNN